MAKLNVIEKCSKSKVTNFISEKHYKNALLQWAIDRTENFPYVKEFQPFCLSLCALLDSFFKEKVNFYSLHPIDIENNAKVIIRTLNELNIPILFELEDIISITKTFVNRKPQNV